MRRPCGCSSSGPGRWRPASTRIAASWRSSPRSCGGSTGCRWPSSWPPPACTRHDVAEVAAGLDRRFDLLSSGYRTSSRHGSLRRGGVVVVRAARRAAAARPSPTCRCSPGRSRPRMRRRSAASTPRRSRPRWTSSSSARWSCGRPTGATCCSRPCGRSAPSSSSPTGRADAGARAPRPPPGRLDRGAPIGGWSSRVRRRAGRDRRRAPGAAHARSAGCSTTTRSSSPAGSSAALLDYGFLRLRPDVLAWAERVAAADPDDRSPLAPLVWAVSGVRRVDGRRRRRERRARAARARRLADRADRR